MDKKMYNALESGVIADGVTDVSATLQNAINTAKEKGLPLYIPTGVYKVSEALKVPSDFNIVASMCAKIVLDGER